MQVTAIRSLDELPTGTALAVFWDGPTPIHPDVWSVVQRRYQGVPGQLMERRRWKGQLGDVLSVPWLGSETGPLYIVGLRDEHHPMTAETLRKACGALGRLVQGDRVDRIALTLPVLENDPRMSLRAALEGLRLGQYNFRKYATTEPGEPEPSVLEQVFFLDVPEPVLASVKTVAEVIADAVALARDLINEPPGYLSPERLAEVAADYASSVGIMVRIYDAADLEAMGAYAFLSVGRGSESPPRMVHLHYRPETKPVGVLGLVGKGITFDSGGLCLKPSASMLDMKGDMAGAAAVLAALWAIGRLKPPVEVHGVLCCAENMPSGRASRPGDVVRAMNGKTIEITNTDAEGRLVLADGLVFTARQGAQKLVDVATLTGAATVALGSQIAAVMSNDEVFQQAFLASARRAGEAFWPLPLERDYKTLIKSDIAFIKNSANSREAGTIIGGLFLSEFTEGRPWVHLDIAGPFWAEKPAFYLAAGGTGFSTRSLIQFTLDQVEAA
ncbi:MAG: leucyl aminopeptidase [Acidobacteria bacterium]|nr:leucyl aminopeptidase [Acidobacteriota bacterium]MDW7984006.1 leucyl aminopeptidase [Acidobacteriota bacterium]